MVKGVKYFFTPEQEKKFNEENNLSYYGNKSIAYGYAKNYFGGLQVYKLKKNIKLFNVTNDKNIKIILNLIKDKIKKGKGDKIIFDKISYKKLYKLIKTKYGVGINKYEQAYNISKYNKYNNDIWLYLPKKDDLPYYINNYDKSYTGWLFNSRYIDIACANCIRLLLKNKFDGITNKTGFYTPYKKQTISLNEIVLWNVQNLLERLPEHKYDTMQFIKHLHFNPFEINFNIKLSHKNDNFRMINFYLNNKLDQKQLNEIKKKSTNQKQLKLMSLNVHNFRSINLNDKEDFILENLINLLDQINIDICFLQEYYINLEIKSEKYNYIKSNDHYGIVVLYKKKLNIKNIKSFKLNGEYLYEKRSCLHFEIDKKKFATTHLEIGKSIFDKTGKLYYPNDLYDIISFNYEIRKNQLKQILDEVPKPDFIIGDFNFNPLDKEFEYITKKKKYYTGLVDETTPFGKQVDFIFSKKPYKFFTSFKYPYSDHLPVIAIVDI